MKVRKLLVGLVVVAVGSLGLVATADPASAWTCQERWKEMTGASAYFKLCWEGSLREIRPSSNVMPPGAYVCHVLVDVAVPSCG